MTEYFAQKSAGPYASTFVITEGKETVKGNMPSSIHLEADFRIVGHILDALKCGYQSVTVRVSDTGVIIILLAFMPKFLQRNPSFKLVLNSGTASIEHFNIYNISV